MPVDPVVTLVVLLQGAMPTAQNLVVLLNLNEKVIITRRKEAAIKFWWPLHNAPPRRTWWCCSTWTERQT